MRAMSFCLKPIADKSVLRQRPRGRIWFGHLSQFREPLIESTISSGVTQIWAYLDQVFWCKTSSQFHSVRSQIQWCCIAVSPLTILYIITALARFLRTSNAFQPSSCIIRVGLPLLLDEHPEWLCSLLQSFMTSCFNLVNVITGSSMWTPDSWSILNLRVHKGSTCPCLHFPSTASGVATDECPSGVSLFSARQHIAYA